MEKFLLRVSNIKGVWTHQLDFNNIDEMLINADLLINEKTFLSDVIEFSSKVKITTLK